MSLQTALDGSIDYSRANPLDPHWLSYWKLLIDVAARRCVEKQVETQIAFRIGQIVLPYVTSENSVEMQKDTLERIDMLARLRQPWLPNREDTDKQLAAEFHELWKEYVGFDIDDDEAVAEWGKKVENVLKAAAQEGGAAASEAQRLTDLVQQRALAVRQKRRKQREH